MSRRICASLLMSALLSWLAIDLVCGATWRLPTPHECATKTANSGCCEHMPVEAGCAAEACGLACAAMLVVQLADARLDIRPASPELRIELEDERAVALRARPLLPPPRLV